MSKNIIRVMYAIFILIFTLIIIGCSEINEPSELAATIYLDNSKQVIRGFGAANILPWRPDMTTDEVNKAFGTGDGQIGFSLLRLRVPWDSSEFNLNIPTALAAQNMGVEIIASPWTPPPWMKTNNYIVGGRLHDTSYTSYAAHLKSFVDYLANNGIQLSAISVQNEPDVRVTYESCDWNAATMLRFMKENAPSIGIDVFAPESANFNHGISDAILNDPVALANTAFIGGHIYGGGLEPYPLAQSKGKGIWMTEHLVLETAWEDNLATGKEILDCMNAGMSAYIWWYIVRFYGPIYDDDPRTPVGAVKGEISKRGYVMSQFARFVRPGYLRISATKNPQQGIYLSAYKNGSDVVIVAINNNSQAINQSFKIQNGSVSSFTQYVTSSSKNCELGSSIQVSNSSFTTTLDGSSITTFVSN